MRFIKGDTIELEITANTDITGWKIRAEFYDIDSSSVQLATVNAGGSDDQISIDTPLSGIFTITCPKGATSGFNNQGFLEIEREDSTGKILTIFQSNIEFADEKITWSTPA
jgi:hypothetical protein